MLMKSCTRLRILVARRFSEHPCRNENQGKTKDHLYVYNPYVNISEKGSSIRRDRMYSKMSE